MPRNQTPKRRQHKTGSVRFKKGKWYIRWYDANGKPREQAASIDKADAERLLRQKVAEVTALDTNHDRKAAGAVTVADVLALGKADAVRRNLASVYIYDLRINGCFSEIARLKAVDFTYQHGLRYVERRRKETISDSTINKELSQLRTAFRLAAHARYKLIPVAPDVPHLEEPDNVRTGFLTESEYEIVKWALCEDLRPLFCVAYFTGMRTSSLLGLKLSQIDMENKLIWVRKTQVKNKKSQAAPILDGDMFTYCQRALDRNNTHLFEWYELKRKRGKPIKDFRDSWLTAVTLAGMPDLRFHDLRRTAVRDYIRSGVPESHALLISGHKTNSMLQRYNIMDAETVTDAAEMRQARLERRQEPGQKWANRGPVSQNKPV